MGMMRLCKNKVVSSSSASSSWPCEAMQGSKKRLAAAERQLDRALEAALEEELDGGGWELPEELEDSEEEDSRCEAADEGSQHVAGTAGEQAMH